MNRKCDEEVKPMRITRISVDGLFGMFNHDIGMKLDDRITIIHGMNGYGKTTILRMVNALFNKRYSDLRTTRQQRFRNEAQWGSRDYRKAEAVAGHPCPTAEERQGSGESRYS